MSPQDRRARLAEVEVKVEVERRPDVLHLSLGLSLNLLMTLADFFSILLGSGRRGQMHFDARVVLIDVFVEVGFDDAVVVDAESLTEGILRDLEPAIDVSS